MTLAAIDILTRADVLLRSGWVSDDEACEGGKYCIRCLLANANTALYVERSTLGTAEVIDDLARTLDAMTGGPPLRSDLVLIEARVLCAKQEGGAIRYDDRERTQRILTAALGAVECREGVMGEISAIEWCDSTSNPEMGCDGCELAARGGSGTCYAETLTNRYAGKSKGYPSDFYKPQIFPGRIEAACKWRDLAGTERPEKPWLNGLPRHIFLDDMGDTFTESLPLDWIAPYIPAMAASPHIWQMLTKRPARMRKFWENYGPVPANFVLMTSLTTGANLSRIKELLRIPDATRGISYEPAVGAIDFDPGMCEHCGSADFNEGPDIQPTCNECGAEVCFGWILGADPGISWLVIGGESGPGARPMRIDWARSAVRQCEHSGCVPFIKQLGGHVITSGCSSPGQRWPSGVNLEDAGKGNFRALLRDRKGGEMSEWPADLRVRQMPEMDL